MELYIEIIVLHVKYVLSVLCNIVLIEYKVTELINQLNYPWIHLRIAKFQQSASEEFAKIMWNIQESSEKVRSCWKLLSNTLIKAARVGQVSAAPHENNK